MVDPEATLEQLLSTRHAEVGLFLVQMRPTPLSQGPDTPAGAEMLRRHLVYLWELEARGVLFASGPVDLHTPDQEGLCILCVGDRAQAEAIAHAEPFHQAGWRRNTVRAWNLNEGESVPVGRAMRDRLKS